MLTDDFDRLLRKMRKTTKQAKNKAFFNRKTFDRTQFLTAFSFVFRETIISHYKKKKGRAKTTVQADS